MCVHWLDGLNLLLALCSKYYFIQIYEIFSIFSLVLWVVIAQFWLLCSALIGCVFVGTVAVTCIGIFSKGVSILLIIGSRGLQCTVNLQKTICCESFGNVRFDLGLLLEGQTRVGQDKSVHNSLIIDSRGLQCTVNLWETISCKSYIKLLVSSLPFTVNTFGYLATDAKKPRVNFLSHMAGDN